MQLSEEFLAVNKVTAKEFDIIKAILLNANIPPKVKSTALKNRNVNCLNEMTGDTLLISLLKDYPYTNEHIAAVEFLLNHGAHPDLVADKTKHSALCLACDRGFEKTVGLLLEKKAKVNFAPTEPGVTPIFLAVQNGKFEILKKLLDERHGAILNYQLPAGRVPGLLYKGIDQACKNIDDPEKFAVYVNIIEFLLTHGADPKISTGNYSIFKRILSCFTGDVENIKKVLSKMLKLIKLLLKYNADLKEDGEALLIKACLVGNLEAIKCLIEHKVNITIKSKGKNLLFLTCLSGNIKATRYLLNNPATRYQIEEVVEEESATILHLATQVGNLPLVRLVLANYDKNINAQASDGTTALSFAAQEGYVDIVKFLLERGADPCIARKDGATPITVAYSQKHNETLFVLMSALIEKEFGSQFNPSDLCNILIEDYEDRLKLTAEFNTHMNFFKPAEKQQTLNALKPTIASAALSSFSMEPQKAESAFAFLQKNGFSKEKINEMRARNEQYRETSKSEQSAENKTIASWLNGSFDSGDIQTIESKAPPTSYFYLCQESLLDTGCQDVSCFQKSRITFCANKGEQGLKPISNPPEITLSLNGKERKVLLIHELKILGNQGQGNKRALCFCLPSDDGQSLLYIAAFFCDHKKNSIEKYRQKNKKFIINLPLKQQRNLTVADCDQDKIALRLTNGLK